MQNCFEFIKRCEKMFYEIFVRDATFVVFSKTYAKI